MSETLKAALLITVVGMGLVFAAILMLWGLMAFIVRVTSDKEPVESHSEEIIAAEYAADDELRVQAAALAVAVAIAAVRSVPAAFPLPLTATASPWQSVMRINQLRARRPRGTVR